MIGVFTCVGCRWCEKTQQCGNWFNHGNNWCGKAVVFESGKLVE